MARCSSPWAWRARALRGCCSARPLPASAQRRNGAGQRSRHAPRAGQGLLDRQRPRARQDHRRDRRGPAARFERGALPARPVAERQNDLAAAAAAYRTAASTGAALRRRARPPRLRARPAGTDGGDALAQFERAVQLEGHVSSMRTTISARRDGGRAISPGRCRRCRRPSRCGPDHAESRYYLGHDAGEPRPARTRRSTSCAPPSG